jgi:hypothetical protein
MIDSDDEQSTTVFVLEDWIGKNRRVPMPDVMPDGLADYFASLKEVPDDINSKSPKMKLVKV